MTVEVCKKRVVGFELTLGLPGVKFHSGLFLIYKEMKALMIRDDCGLNVNKGMNYLYGVSDVTFNKSDTTFLVMNIKLKNA